MMLDFKGKSLLCVGRGYEPCNLTLLLPVDKCNEYFSGEPQFFDMAFVNEDIHSFPKRKSVLSLICEYTTGSACVKSNQDGEFLTKYFLSHDFSSAAGERDTDNSVLYLFKKNKVESIGLPLDKATKFLIIGPGCSGKSTLVYKVGRFGKYGKNTFNKYRVLFLDPIRLYSRKLHKMDWMKYVVENNASVIVCYCPKHIRKKRLLTRAKAKKYLPFKKISKTYNWFERLLSGDKSLLDKTNLDDISKVRILKNFHYSYCFDYQELHCALRSFGIRFYVMNCY